MEKSSSNENNGNNEKTQPRFNANDPVIRNIVNAFVTGAKVTIAGTALYTMNQETRGAVMSAINMISGAANKMFVTSAGAVPVAINTLSMTANEIVVSSINECASQLYQTGAAFVTVLSGLLKYTINYIPDAVKVVGAVGASIAVNTLNDFRSLSDDNKKMYLQKYLATVLNSIVDVHKHSINLSKELAEGVTTYAECVKPSEGFINDIGGLTSAELREMVEFVIPYMRSAEYNLSPEDLSFMAGNPVPFDGSNLEFRLARNVQRAIALLKNDKLFLEEEYGSDSDDDANEHIQKKQKTSYFSDRNADKVMKHIDRMLYLLNELDCSSCGLQRIHSDTSAYKVNTPYEKQSFSQPFGGKKSKRTQKRKPVIRRKQTTRVQRKQTKRLQKNRRKKQTKK